MAFDLKNKFNGLGNGSLGSYYVDAGFFDKINSYAKILSVDKNVITIDLENAIIGEFDSFVAGTDVLIHISASLNNNADKLGEYLCARIELTDRNVLTLDKDVSTLLTNDELSEYAAQIITIPNFDSFTISENAELSPPPFDPFKYIGGIFILRCRGDLIFEGGHINLVDTGLPANRKNQLRPLYWQETNSNGELDTAKFSSAENYLTVKQIQLNAGDGAAILLAKKLVCDERSRIGNPKTHGAQYCRGQSNSVGVKPSNVTGIGGSSILICAESIQNFTPKIIAKYRDVERVEGAGLSRCLIASNSKLPNDEGLYSYMNLSDDLRVMNELNITDFGNGSFGDMQNAKACLNNFAKVVKIKNGGYKIRYTNKTFSGLAPLGAGSLILAQVLIKYAEFTKPVGRFTIAKVLSDNGYSMELSNAVPNVDLTHYDIQIISIPQFKNYTQSENHNFTKKFDGNTGGVLAVACSETLDLTDGQFNVENKGGGIAYGRAGLQTIGNCQMYNSLPLGQGHGSIFILAKNLVMNANSRIGATYSGNGENQKGGYKGVDVIPAVNEASTGGFVGGGAASSDLKGLIGGSGYSGGIQAPTYDASKIVGGYGSNGADGNGYEGGKQGAHIFIIADKIEGFTQAAISTGGGKGLGDVDGKNGAASRGGSGSINGSSGGSGGFAFIYSN